MPDRVVVQADGSMPVRTKPACPCEACKADFDAAPSARHGSMARFESGCSCATCRMWDFRFRRILEREADDQHFEPYGRDAFEPEAASDPQPRQGGGGSSRSLIRRLWPL